jgi:pimeloyl-ACP methyl ester carboxylesterase
MKKHIYIFSGLGADERMFQHLDCGAYEVKHIPWILPCKNESISNYAQRILTQIETKNPILIGLSFGGMIAIEVSKLIQTEKVILISSVKSRFELPMIYKLLGKLHIHKIIPAFLLKKSNFITYWLFGVSSQEDKALLKDILKNTDSQFLKWAISTILIWNNNEIPTNLYHIHGTKDRILPFKKIQSAEKIKDGGHLMVLDKSDLIQDLLDQMLEINQ